MNFGGYFEYDKKSQRLLEVNAELESPKVWDDANRARELGKEKRLIDDVISRINSLTTESQGAAELLELAEMDGDEATLLSLKVDVSKVNAILAELEFKRMFSGEQDVSNCFLDINSGSGGTEAQDWAQMLFRMYCRYGERRGFKVEILEESDGDVAGLKSASIKLTGDFAYGYLRTETGIHRLVRKSPFDSNARRHTSFASVFVYPEVDDSIEIDINPSDVRTDTFRASGAGGQHINKTDSAVRITHLPTGIVAECQDGRSQHGNKAQAMKVLTARIIEKDRSERAAKDAAERKGLMGTGDRSDRIRTYNFPQGRLNHRINLTLYKLLGIMEGDLDDVVQALQAYEAAEQLAELEIASAA